MKPAVATVAVHEIYVVEECFNLQIELKHFVYGVRELLLVFEQVVYVVFELFFDQVKQQVGKFNLNVYKFLEFLQNAN